MSDREDELLQDNKSTSPQLGEHERALSITDDASKIMEQAEAQVSECMLLLDEDLKNLKESKASLKSEALDESQKLLLDLGFEASMLEDEPEVAFGYEEEDKQEKVEVKSVSSGKFTSFLLASIIGAILTVISLFASAKSIGISLDFNKLSDIDYLMPLLQPIGKLFITDASANVGGAVLVGIIFIIMYIIYIIRVSLRATQNLKDAQATHEQAEFYCTSKEECKKEMDRVDAHLNETIKTIEYFKVLLSEQNAKLRRVLFIEEKQNFQFYHYKTQIELENSQKLVNAINNLLGTPMAERGRLSSEAEDVLVKTKLVVNKYIQTIYDKNIDDVL